MGAKSLASDDEGIGNSGRDQGCSEIDSGRDGDRFEGEESDDDEDEDGQKEENWSEYNPSGGISDQRSERSSERSGDDDEESNSWPRYCHISNGDESAAIWDEGNIAAEDNMMGDVDLARPLEDESNGTVNIFANGDNDDGDGDNKGKSS